MQRFDGRHVTLGLLAVGGAAMLDMRAAALAGVAMCLLFRVAQRAPGRVRVRLPERHEASGLPFAAARIAELSGALLYWSADSIDQILPRSPPWPKYVIVDLRRATMIDASALNALRHVLECLEARDGRFMLVCLPGSEVFSTIQGTGLFERALGGTCCFTLTHALERAAAAEPRARAAEPSPRPERVTLRLVPRALDSVP